MPVEGSLVNVRIIAVMSGGILFGPWVGVITGVIAGTHRYLIDIGGVTAVPCFITSIIAGVLSGWIGRKIPKTALARRDCCGHDVRNADHDPGRRLGPTTALGLDIVSKIGIPMIPAASASVLSCCWCRALKGKRGQRRPSGQAGAGYCQQNAAALSPR